jgi:hypothetical protein
VVGFHAMRRNSKLDCSGLTYSDLLPAISAIILYPPVPSFQSLYVPRTRPGLEFDEADHIENPSVLARLV